jgi:hypothetical protein
VEAEGNSAAMERAYFRDQDRPKRILGNRLRSRFPDLTLEDASFEALSLDDAPVRYAFSARSARFARREGARLSLPLALALPELPLETLSPDRDVAVWLPDPFVHTVEARIRLPSGFEVVERPQDRRITSPWLEASLATRATRRGMEVSVRLRFLGGEVPVERVGELSATLVELRRLLDERLIARERSRR